MSDIENSGNDTLTPEDLTIINPLATASPEPSTFERSGDDLDPPEMEAQRLVSKHNITIEGMMGTSLSSVLVCSPYPKPPNHVKIRYAHDEGVIPPNVVISGSPASRANLSDFWAEATMLGGLMKSKDKEVFFRFLFETLLNLIQLMLKKASGGGQ